MLVSALLGFMAVSGVLGRWNLAGLRVRLEVPDEIYDGAQTLLGVRLENRKRWLPAFLVEVVLPAGRTAFTMVERRGSAAAPLVAVFHGRGVKTLPQAQVRSIFPINFFVRSFVLPLERQITVFPAPRPCRAAGAEGKAQAGELPLANKGYEGDISRISAYRGGEPLKLIHWKLSARQDELKVKELSAAARPPVIVDPDHLPGSGLEERLRCACFLVGSLLRAGRPVGLRLGGRTLPPAAGRAHKLRLLSELARHGHD